MHRKLWHEKHVQLIGGYAAPVDPVALSPPIAPELRTPPIPGQQKKVVEILCSLPGVVERLLPPIGCNAQATVPALAHHAAS